MCLGLLGAVGVNSLLGFLGVNLGGILDSNSVEVLKNLDLVDLGVVDSALDSTKNGVDSVADFTLNVADSAKNMKDSANDIDSARFALDSVASANDINTTNAIDSTILKDSATSAATTISANLGFLFLLPFVILGSVFPDIDEPRSFIGRKLPIISHLVSLSFSHRGFTHFLIFGILVAMCGVVVLFYSQVLGLCVFAFAFGILMHQVGDMMTISGIPYYFFPLSSKKAVLLPRFLRFRTGGAVEKGILYGIFIPLIAFLGLESAGLASSVGDLVMNLENILTNLGGLLSK